MNLGLKLEMGTPYRRQLEQALREAIRAGRLPPDTQLPPSRVLAEELGVSRGVVVDTYAQLTAEGYLWAHQGSGTRVARLPEPLAPPEPRRVDPPERYRYDLRPGQADFHAFPRRRWQSALLAAARELPDRRLTYSPHRGAPELRNAAAEHIRRLRGVVADPEQVVICIATSHALGVLWHALRARGARRVAIEDPSWRWQRFTIEQAGLEAVPVRVDREGLVVSDLAAAGVDAVVTTPAHQYPTGVSMSAERRRALVTWAREHGALIVEDDYDVEYRYDRDPTSALQGLAPDRVAFVGTVSKTLAPALRMAWIAVPTWLVDDVGHQLRVTGVAPPTIDQVALASFIADAGLERHLRQMRSRYAAKRHLLVETLERKLPGVELSGVAAGLHVLVWLPHGVDEHLAAERTRQAGVGVHELHRHCTTVAPRPAAFIIGFALPSESEIRKGIDLIAQAVRETEKAKPMRRRSAPAARTR